MIELPFLFALQAGMISTVSPCAFPLLPAWISYHLGAQDAGFEKISRTRRASRALLLGLIATLGFLAISGGVGLAVVLGGRMLVREYLPQVATVLGVGLLALGFILLATGRSFSLPLHMGGTTRRGHVAVFLFGIAYGTAAIGCTLPLFLLVIVNALTLGGPAGAALQFGVYALGMGAVLTSVTLGAALFRGVVAVWLRRVMPYVEYVSTVMLILAGGYIIVYHRTAGGIDALSYASGWGAALLASTLVITLIRWRVTGRVLATEA